MTAPDPPPRTVRYPPPEDPDEAEDSRLEELEAQDRAFDEWPADVLWRMWTLP